LPLCIPRFSFFLPLVVLLVHLFGERTMVFSLEASNFHEDKHQQRLSSHGSPPSRDIFLALPRKVMGPSKHGYRKSFLFLSIWVFPGFLPPAKIATLTFFFSSKSSSFVPPSMDIGLLFPLWPFPRALFLLAFFFPPSERSADEQRIYYLIRNSSSFPRICSPSDLEEPPQPHYSLL